MDNNYKILNTINSPNDLKKLNIESINLLADEIALYIHNTVSDIGGHYSSPLGVIDLTLALHYVYNSPEDKIIWDVGHQAYSHKILTGRREEFANMRRKNGMKMRPQKQGKHLNYFLQIITGKLWNLYKIKTSQRLNKKNNF